MYADDAIIYTVSQRITEIERALANEVNNTIWNWLHDNRLIVNLKKRETEAMLFRTAKRCSMIDSDK